MGDKNLWAEQKSGGGAGGADLVLWCNSSGQRMGWELLAYFVGTYKVCRVDLAQLLKGRM